MNEIRCSRCHGPAIMIDKAPRGERGDVIRCHAEETCSAVSAAAVDLEQAHLAVSDAALEFVRLVGKPSARGEIKIPAYAYSDLADAVQEWKDAGERLIAAQRKHAARATAAA